MTAFSVILKENGWPNAFADISFLRLALEAAPGGPQHLLDNLPGCGAIALLDPQLPAGTAEAVLVSAEVWRKIVRALIALDLLLGS
jgi:hypothetical protein